MLIFFRVLGQSAAIFSNSGTEVPHFNFSLEGQIAFFTGRPHVLPPAPRCGISRFISFTAELNEGKRRFKHGDGAATTDLEPAPATGEAASAGGDFTFQLSLLIHDCKRKLSLDVKEGLFSQHSASYEGAKQESGLSKVQKVLSVFSAKQKLKKKKGIIYLTRHIFLIRSSSKGCNCVPVVPLPLSKCNESCCL